MPDVSKSACGVICEILTYLSSCWSGKVTIYLLDHEGETRTRAILFLFNYGHEPRLRLRIGRLKKKVISDEGDNTKHYLTIFSDPPRFEISVYYTTFYVM